MADTVTSPAFMRKCLIASLMGNALEWYDFFLYGTAAALVFGTIFFPQNTDPVLGTLGAFAGFAVGFIARPLGGLIFGHLGDRFGHARSLVWTLSLMGAATFGMGLMPGYAQIGWLSPVGLVVLRLVQGAASGGEWGGGVLLLSESAPANRRGFLAAFSQMGVSFGFCLAAMAFYLVQWLPDDMFMSWGWRIPFLASLLLFGVGIYIRRRLPEHGPAKQHNHSSVPSVPALHVIKHYPGPLLQAMGLRIAENGAAYIFMTFSMAYARFVHVNTQYVLVASAIAMVAEAFTIVAWGWLSDRWGHLSVYGVGCGVLLLWSIPFFQLIATGSSLAILLALLVGLPVCHAAMIGTQPALMSSLFPAQLRYTGIAMGHEIASIFAGGLAPLAATALFGYFDSVWPVSIMLIMFSLLTVWALLYIHRQAACQRDD